MTKMTKPPMSLRALTAAFAIAAGFASVASAAQAPKAKIEPQADQQLRKMCDFLAAQKRFSFKSESDTEIVLKSGEKLELGASSKVAVERPNKLRSERAGEVAQDLTFYYDGKTVSLYGATQGLYATSPAPGNLDQMIDFTRDKLGLEAPAADLLYQDPYRTLTEDVVSGRYIGRSVVDGQVVHHLAFRGNQTDWQIWIDDGDKPLPRKYLITSKKVKGMPEFTVRIEDWNLSPSIDEGTFAFTPPKEANRIQFARRDGQQKKVQAAGRAGGKNE